MAAGPPQASAPPPPSSANWGYQTPGHAGKGCGPQQTGAGPQLQPPDPWAQAAQAGKGPQVFQMNTPVACHAKFSEKVALLPQYQFDGDNKKGGAWRGVVRPYLASRAPEMETLLLNVEASEDEKASVAALINRGLAVHPSTIHALAGELWSFLLLVLQGEARIWLSNTKSFEGFDVWREVLKSIRSRSEIRRHEILSHLHRPPTAHKLAEVLMAIEKWDGTHREYVEAGGQPLPFEERRASLLQIHPPSFRQDAFFCIPAMQES